MARTMRVSAGYRSAKTGKKVSAKYAKSHPVTTVRETRVVPAKKK